MDHKKASQSQPSLLFHLLKKNLIGEKQDHYRAVSQPQMRKPNKESVISHHLTWPVGSKCLFVTGTSFFKLAC